jgi:5-(carboxyamino)imidazole ribonucleotide synthase
MKTIQDTRIGLLGGGQLGRMFVQNALNWGVQLAILDADANAPCAECCSNFVQGDLLDFDAVYNFGKNCDLLTIEIERVNTSALRQLEAEGVRVYPQPHIIELIQDKFTQKQFFKQYGFATTDFEAVENKNELQKYIPKFPLVQKLRRDGYDGRGVQILVSPADYSDKAFDKPSIVETLADIDQEIAVMVSRNEAGEVRTFAPVASVFHPQANLVEFLISPAQISADISDKAQSLAVQIVEQLGMVGILGVEFFLTKSGELLVNEIAPRTHNSGHTTIEANRSSQFDQHLRAVLNLPLGDVSAFSSAAMVNLLGEAAHSGVAFYEGLEDVMRLSGVYLHLYGKRETRPFRKMGHITILRDNIEELQSLAQYVKNTVKVVSKNNL